MNEPLIRRIKKRLKATGRSMRAVSMDATGKPDLVRKIFKGEIDWPRGDTVLRLAASLDTTEAWLLREEGPEEAPLSRATTADDAISVSDSSSRRAMIRNVPLMGTAAGSHAAGAEVLNGVVDYVERPDALLGRPDIYALRIVNDSMMPAHNPGDLRYIDPHAQVRPGDAVIVQTSPGAMGDVEAIIGILISRSPVGVNLEKLNPRQTISISRAKVLAVHKVV